MGIYAITVKVLNKNKTPAVGKKVTIRSFIGFYREPLDWDEITNADGIAQYMIIDPGLKELYIDGVLKLEFNHLERTEDNFEIDL